MGILCYYDLFNRLKEGGQVLLEDIHPFWWYDRTKACTTAENEVPKAVVLDPAIVKGKGRPKGSKGKKGLGLHGITIPLKYTIL